MLELLPLLNVSDETKNILTCFSAGQTCSIIGREHGVPGKCITTSQLQYQTILLVPKRVRLISAFASLWNHSGLKDSILNAPDLSQRQRKILLDLSETHSVTAASNKNKCNFGYVYQALRKFSNYPERKILSATQSILKLSFDPGCARKPHSLL